MWPDNLTFNAGKEAGLAFEKAASIQGQHLNEPDDQANTYQEAFSKSASICHMNS